jgi:hypothetical protein
MHKVSPERKDMSYRNKTYVAFASEDIHLYRLMEAWRENENIDFSFFDAHDLYISRDTSTPQTIRDNLRKRMSNAKQIVLIGSSTAKKKGDDSSSFLGYEIDTVINLKLPVVVANKDGGRTVNRAFIPGKLLNINYDTVSVSLQSKIIQRALDYYVAEFPTSSKVGPHQYPASVYASLGI